MTDVLGLGLSPRQNGNSDLLLEAFLSGAREAGAETRAIFPRDLDLMGCTECGGCDETGECIYRDDMDDVYPLLAAARRVVVATPIFFYGPPAVGKALVDRSQALWNRFRLDPDLRKPDGKGFLLAVGATKGKNLFDGTVLTAKYFMDAIGLPLTMESLLYRQVEAQGAIKDHPRALAEALEAGRRFAG